MKNEAINSKTIPTLEKAPYALALVVKNKPALKSRLMGLLKFVITSVGRFRMARDMDWNTWRRLEYRNDFPDYDSKHPIEHRMWS